MRMMSQIDAARRPDCVPAKRRRRTRVRAVREGRRTDTPEQAHQNRAQEVRMKLAMGEKRCAL